jgi:hypothetical protein
MNIITNGHHRDVIDAWQLTPAERAEFDYLDWGAIEAGNDSASFFRYRGELHDLGEFTANWGLSRDSGLPDSLAGWDGHRSDSFFSALVVRYVDNYEGVVVGLVLS